MSIAPIRNINRKAMKKYNPMSRIKKGFKDNNKLTFFNKGINE